MQELKGLKRLRSLIHGYLGGARAYHMLVRGHDNCTLLDPDAYTETESWYPILSLALPISNEF